jgi:hypothetical protein
VTPESPEKLVLATSVGGATLRYGSAVVALVTGEERGIEANIARCRGSTKRASGT